MKGTDMKPFSLEEHLKNPERKVVTRDGRDVRIHCTNYGGLQPIIAEIEGIGFSESFTKYGGYYNPRESRNDLFFAPEKHEGWINVYRNMVYNEAYGGRIYDSYEEAKSHANNATIATAKIEWEE